MDVWWPSQLFDSEDVCYGIEGNDETALVVVSSETLVVNYVMQCDIIEVWRYQPIAATPTPRAIVTPSVVTPSGDFRRIWEMPSEVHGDEPVKNYLGMATGPEQAVWMSRADILWRGQFLPKPLKHNDWIVRRLDNDQVYVLRIVPLERPTWLVWEAALGIPRQADEEDFLGTIQHFRVTRPCADGRARCIQHGLMIWTPGDPLSQVKVLYGDGLWDFFYSSVGWIAVHCPGSRGELDICAIKSDGAAQIKLADHPAKDWWPRWSPDRSQLAFASQRDGVYDQIYLLKAGGQVQRLTSTPGSNTAPTWSPDGKRIAFQSTRDGNNEIYVMNSDGTGQTNLTRNRFDDFYPAWSPDGRRITFDSYRDGQRRIWVMNSDGTNVVRLSDGRFDHKAAWSPDGQRIAFVSQRDGNDEIYVMNADGSNPKRLTYNSEPDINPVWSPDGKQIAYCYYAQGVYRIFIMNADGSGGFSLRTGIEGCPYSWH